MEESIFELKHLLERLRYSGSYFLEFVNSGKLEAGIIRLRPGDVDTQEPHSKDELYYVVEGRGHIEIGSRDYKIKQGSLIFIPARVSHKFVKNIEDLIVLYFFGS